MEPKKISFGFMKTKKQEKPVITEQREYIESVEQNSIKIIGQEVATEAEPLVIPMKPNTLITAERLKEIAEKVESAINEPEKEQEDKKNQDQPIKKSENETLDQMAARELLQEARQEKKVETESLKISIPSIPVIEGQKESSLEDYDSVPIQEFGMAMLRGMGWTPGKETSKYKLPNLRPKGLGLGADKVIMDNQKKNTQKDNIEKDLEIIQNACVKITFGKYNGCYGKVISLDEDNGRVMVNIPIKKETVSLSEFMMQPVTKTEFDKQSKVLNADTYEAYKKSENTHKSSEKSSKREKESSSSHKSKYTEKDRNESEKSDKNERRDRESYSQQRDNEKHSNGRNKEYNRNQELSSSEEEYRHRKREKKRYSSDSLSSDSDRRKRKENKRKEKYSSSDSEENNYKKRDKSGKKKKDIDKKRKGKKKKRDRDRSPGYRKHRK